MATLTAVRAIFLAVPLNARRGYAAQSGSDADPRADPTPQRLPQMPRALVDLKTLDLERNVMSEEELRSLLPHRFEFQLIDGVCHLDLATGVIVTYKDWDVDAWWARGHIPGRPLMPGVLIAEGAAQTASILMKKTGATAPESFIGLGGLDDVRFRGQVVPPTRIHWVSVVGTQSGGRLARYPAQAFNEGKLVMEMSLLGVIF